MVDSVAYVLNIARMGLDVNEFVESITSCFETDEVGGLE